MIWTNNEIRHLDSKVSKLRKGIEEKKTLKLDTLKRISEHKRENRDLENRAKKIEEAQVIIKEVAQITQKKFEYRISEIVTLALKAVFEENAYDFRVKIIPKRGKTEAHLLFVRDENEIDPIDASGGGAVDVASFALRVSLWALQNPRTRNVLILDEPFKNLSANYMPKAAEMLKLISSKLNIQIIMVTHNEKLIETSDKIFRVELHNKISKVTEE